MHIAAGVDVRRTQRAERPSIYIFTTFKQFLFIMQFVQQFINKLSY